MIRTLDLFSGIGGISLGLERDGGFRTVAFCESEPFARKVLAKHWPGVWCHDDVRTLTADAVRSRVAGSIDAIVGGFPCQQISNAGAGEGIGTEDAPTERSGLWWHMLRLIRELRPRWIIAENVAALRTRGADAVLAGLEDAGYACWASVVGAWAVGAPHRRDRVWIVARRRAVGLADPASVLARPGHQPAGDHRSGRDGPHRWPAGRGQPQHDWEPPRLVPGPPLKRRLGRGPDGIPAGVDTHRAARLKAIGNSVVPQVVEAIGRAILEMEKTENV